MSSIEVGGQEIALERPADLAGRVLVVTGLGVAELAAMLARPTVVLAAAALLVLSTGDRSRAELGELVGADDAVRIGTEIQPYFSEDNVHGGE